MKLSFAALSVLTLIACTDPYASDTDPIVVIEPPKAAKPTAAQPAPPQKGASDPLESSYTRNVSDGDKPIIRNYIDFYGVPLHEPHVVRAAYLRDLEIRSYISPTGEQLNVYETLPKKYCGGDPNLYACCMPTKGSRISRIAGLMNPEGRTAHAMFKVEGVDVTKGGACPASTFYFVEQDQRVFAAVEDDVMQHIYNEGLKSVIKEEEARRASAK